MFEKIKKIKKLSIYNPQAVTALIVFLSGPRTKIRKLIIISFNALYHAGSSLQLFEQINIA